MWKFNLKRPRLLLATIREAGQLGKFDMRSQNKRSISNMYKFFKDISEQPGRFGNTNVHKAQ
jgi:hypothetical protein